MLPLEPAGVTRRVLLVGAVGVPLLLSTSACTEDAPVSPPADPDREALEAAREVEAATLLALDGWSGSPADGTATPVAAREVISAHVTALEAALSATPSASPSPSGSASYELTPTLTVEQVVVLLDSTAGDHTRALRTASPEISPLLASIAASDAALAAAIRRSS